MINNDKYWNERFSSGDLKENKGNKQTLFQYNVLLNHMPQWLKKEISDNNMSICDLGCGMGEGTYLLKKYFKDSEVTGVDFSNYAIKKAKKKYVNASFICSDITKIERHYDVVVSSHKLEHFEAPNKFFKDIINLADKFFILIIPFQEEKLYKEHLYSFDYDFFPITIQDHQLVHYKEIDRLFEPIYWDEKQIVIVYANKKNVDVTKFSLEELNNNYFTEFRLAKGNYEAKVSSLEKFNKSLEDQNKVLESRLIHEKRRCDAIRNQNVYLEGSLKAYQLRKVVKITDTVLRRGQSLKSTLKKLFNKNSLEFYDYSEVHKTKPKKLKDIRVAVILDEFSYNSFKYEFNAIPIEPSNWLEIFESEKPDLFLCESAWSGVDSELRLWKGKIFSSTNFKHENRTILLSILEYCKKYHIPTIFWNKEDPTHYDDKLCNFVDTALKFDHIFTTAEECVERYKNEYGHQSVHCLMFGAQPKLFNPIEEQERSEDVIFAGSWYNTHPQRCIEMEKIFDNILDNDYNLKIYDRTYYTHQNDVNRLFPVKYSKYINPSVPFDQINQVYKESKYALNINTVTDSDTMFARRVFELMLCNTLVLSNYSKGIINLFGENVIIVGRNKIDLGDSEEKRISNLYNVLKNHTYYIRFKQLLTAINFEYIDEDSSISVYYLVNNESEIEEILEHYTSITYNSKKLILLLSNQIPNHLIKNIYQDYSNDNISIYSLNYLLNQNGTIPNKTNYFIFANLNLKPDFIEKGLLHYSYIEKKFGIALGGKFTFKKVKSIENVLLSNENFINAFNSIFKDEFIEFSVYLIQISSNEQSTILTDKNLKVVQNKLVHPNSSKLVVSYCFPPYADSSGNVMAKRVRERDDMVDVIQNDVSDIRNVDKSLNLLTKGLIEDQILIDSVSKDSFGNWDLIYDFCKKGMEKIKENVGKKGEYEAIYSRTFLPASHFLAFMSKITYPNTKWIAEFSDPVLYNEKGKIRYSKLNDKEFMDKVNNLLVKNGFPEDKQANLFFLCEYLPYVFADEIVFTNENQKDYMINKFPLKEVSTIIDKKAKIKRHPTLKKEFYNLIESDYFLDANYVNFAYFGRNYETRNLNDIFHALNELNNCYKSKCKLHIFTSNPKDFKESIKYDSIKKNLQVNSYVNFLEFLNLTTKFDCLIVNDAQKKGEINPYLPSKLSDYLGSGTDIWILYEEGSAMSKINQNYKSIIGDTKSVTQTLKQIIKDHT